MCQTMYVFDISHLPLGEKGVFYNWVYNSTLSCNEHLHFTIILHPWVISDKLHKLQNIQLTIYTINCNFITITPFQLLCNSFMTITIMSCWCHFSSIHQNLTCGAMKFFGWFLKKILISTTHYDCSLKMVLDYSK